MAKELETLLRNFEALGENYCGNFRAVLGEAEATRLLDIYEPGLRQGMAGLSDLLMGKYGALSKRDRDNCDRRVAVSGVQEMLAAANTILKGNEIENSDVLVFASELFPKIKRFLRLIMSIEEGDDEDILLRFIDDIINNIIKFATEGAIQRPQQLPPAPDED